MGLTLAVDEERSAREQSNADAQLSSAQAVQARKLADARAREVDLARKEGLYVSARVGPVSNAELVGEGIPEWLIKNVPEISVERSGVNNLPHAMLLSYLNPTFQKFVGAWIDGSP